MLNVRFSSSGAGAEQDELAQMYDSLTAALVVVDFNEARITLGQMSGTRIGPVAIHNILDARGLQTMMVTRVLNTVMYSAIQQIVLLMGTPRILGNPRKLVWILLHCFALVNVEVLCFSHVRRHMGLTALQKVGLIALLAGEVFLRFQVFCTLFWVLLFEAFQGAFFAVQKICTTFAFGRSYKPPDAVVNPYSPSMTEGLADLVLFGLPWHPLQCMINFMNRLLGRDSGAMSTDRCQTNRFQVSVPHVGSDFSTGIFSVFAQCPVTMSDLRSVLLCVLSDAAQSEDAQTVSCRIVYARRHFGCTAFPEIDESGPESGPMSVSAMSAL